MRIATFNVQTLRLRRPHGRARLDGARDGDMAMDDGPIAAALDFADRRLTARLLAQSDADVVCLQEVFDLATLDYFHDHYLVAGAGSAPWPHRVCVPGNDGGGRDVAIMSRIPVTHWRSHAKLAPADLGLDAPPGVDPNRPVFRRDCLVADITGLTLFVCHFKAPWPDAQASWPVRRLEALAVRRLVERRFANPAQAMWLVAGDLNEPREPGSGERAIAPLCGDFSVDLSQRLPERERWSHFDSATGLLSFPDRFLASPALAAGCPAAAPAIVRLGMSREAGEGQRFADVGAHRPHASDHALLALDLPGIGEG